MRRNVMKDSGLVWWEQVSGPSLFLEAAISALTEGKHLYLQIPAVFPWGESFLSLLKEAVAERVRGGLIYETPEEGFQNLGERLVEYFDLGAFYRPTQSYSVFLRQSKALAEKVICAVGASKAWLEFAREYKPASWRDGLLLLQTRDTPPPGLPGYIKALSYDDFVSEYDMQIFAALLIDDGNLSGDQRKYFTTLAVSLFDDDALGVVDFIRKRRFDQYDPAPLADPSAAADADRMRRVWSAQVQSLFPLIMREYRAFMDTWRPRIAEAFAFADRSLPRGLTDTTGERIVSPEEMEIASLRYLMRHRRYDGNGRETPDYFLYIPSEAARDRIELLYSMRNLIAHGRVCPLDQVVRLLTPGK